MLVVETISQIRRLHFVEGRSIRQICRELHVSRNRVRKVLRSGSTAFSYDRSTQPRPKIDPWRSDLDAMLAENARRAKRERLTLVRIYEELRSRGYDGGYDAVRRYAAGWSKRTREASAGAYVPLRFDPGEAYQFDWSHEVVILDGVTVTIKVAHVRLCHSRMPFVRAYPRETQEMVFDAHDKAFAFFGGACARGIYDNMKTAVDAIFVGKERSYNRRFAQMCGHYLVEPVACAPASGWEKGQVENQVGVLRRRFFVPRPKFKSCEELNGWLADRCVAYATANRHPDVADKTIWEMFQVERSSLIPYVGPFDGFHSVPASVSKTCLIRFDKNRYSVDARAVGRPVEIRAYADRLECWQDGKIVGRHARDFGRGNTVYDPLHYLPVLARKPGALRNGAPFKDWDLPTALRRVQDKLERQPGGDRQMVEILAAILSDGLEAVEAACAEALSDKVHSAGVVLNILARHRDPPPPLTITTPDALQLAREPAADCDRYDSLRRASNGTITSAGRHGQTEALRHEDGL
ncbi:MAG: IS21 family transposase [Rhodothalassiaceae bacterium]